VQNSIFQIEVSLLGQFSRRAAGAPKLFYDKTAMAADGLTAKEKAA